MTSADARHAGAPRDDAPLHTLIMQHTVNGRLRMRAVQGIAQECGCHIRHVECAALLSGILPERYARNTKQFSLEDQRALLLSRVLLVGLGGLGGHVLDMLVRLGVGHITAADGDVFEPSNLNRQLLSSMSRVGTSKAQAARDHARNTNPATELTVVDHYVDALSLPPLLQQCHLVIDALGGLRSRLMLQKAAQNAGVPLVTAAVGGLTGYVATVLPDQTGPAELLGSGGTGEPVEDTLGTPAPVVACAAALQCTEAAKILTGKPPSRGVLFFDLNDRTFQTVML
ncbi:ThiF family adenylyltransferase [Oleidesulfovibrio alaskensis]|uniref:ThiF family adenylyltransferase n=1 Tax=Oleidesulfovibrio alaskensis TaxID=58180 RepID=UPI001A468BE4|nr:ThiF family adenylyltransferase [Oleidesulfovibrio alaskensis]MBL3581773.1 ThiF family adenylyltransferase [Oleidesulfovibrio alaskensis]